MKLKAHSRLGRPKDIAKRDAIMAAAAKLFLSEGFDAVTMDQVAMQAGVSKMTIYSHFDDKETLFENFLTSISDGMTEALDSKIDEGLSLRDRLEITGRGFLQTIGGPLIPSMLLSIIMIRKNPTLARRFYNAGPGRTRAALITLIQKYASRGELQVIRAEWAVDDLMGLWEGGLPAKMMLGIGGPLTLSEIKRRASRAVDVFLRAYAVAPKANVLHRRPR
jgi:TetR/AcrR family transcriptional repressor of mexJK operon